MSGANISDSRELPGDRVLWLQYVCTALVAVAASYRHGRDFALRYGPDEVTAALWPLIVDGLLTMATVELWVTGRRAQAVGGQGSAWVAFGFGICLSLCANIAAAPRLSVLAVAVAAWPPLALLLAVELLNQALKRHRIDARHGDATRWPRLPGRRPGEPGPVAGSHPEGGQRGADDVDLLPHPTSRRPDTDRLSIDQVGTAIHLYTLGWSLARVGEHLGVDPTTVLNQFRRRGVRTRDAHGRPQS